MECLGRKILREELSSLLLGPVREVGRVQGESNWEKTGEEDWGRVHIMSNGAGRVLDSGNNELANALIDSLSEAVANFTEDSAGNRTFLIDSDSAAGQRLIRRFGSPDASGILTEPGGARLSICRWRGKKCSRTRIS